MRTSAEVVIPSTFISLSLFLSLTRAFSSFLSLFLSWDHNSPLSRKSYFARRSSESPVNSERSFPLFAALSRGVFPWRERRLSFARSANLTSSSRGMFREKRYTSGARVPSLLSVSDCLESVWFITAQRSLIFLDAARPRSLNHFPTFFPSRASFFARTPHSNRRKLLKPLLKLTDRFLEPGSIAPIFFHLCHDNEFIFFVFSTSSTWHFHSSTPFFLRLGIF